MDTVRGAMPEGAAPEQGALYYKDFIVAQHFHGPG
jgi:hypothetical protein